MTLDGVQGESGFWGPGPWQLDLLDGDCVVVLVDHERFNLGLFDVERTIYVDAPELDDRAGERGPQGVVADGDRFRRESVWRSLSLAGPGRSGSGASSWPMALGRPCYFFLSLLLCYASFSHLLCFCSSLLRCVFGLDLLCF